MEHFSSYYAQNSSFREGFALMKSFHDDLTILNKFLVTESLHDKRSVYVALSQTYTTF